MDPSVLDGLDRTCDFDQLEGGLFRLGKRRSVANFTGSAGCGDMGNVDQVVLKPVAIEGFAAGAALMEFGFCDGRSSPAFHIAYLRAAQSCWSRQA